MAPLCVLLTWCCIASALHVLASKHARQHIDDKPSHKETLMWAVTMRDYAENDAEIVADLTGSLEMVVLGPCHVIHRCYILAHRNHSIHISNFSRHDHHHYHSKLAYDIDGDLLRDVKSAVHQSLDAHPSVATYSEIWVRRRFKRQLSFQDPWFDRQWHLENTGEFRGHDINVTGVWERNVTGRGVTVAIVDDGLEWTNPDLQENYNSEGSYDLDGADHDPTPDYTTSSDFNAHGTRCAGEVAAVPNSVCAVGVAYGAKVSGIRVLDGVMTDSLEAAAFTIRNDINDVYSCSWGPQDDGSTVDGPHKLAQAALVRGVTQGRNGYGSIFVLASGNGGGADDNCNFDGYANSIYTVTIGAVDENHGKPYYAEDCAAMLAVTFSSGTNPMRSIATTDVRHGVRTGCTDQHSGTSAAAPIAAGMVALMLDARPCLTWRDVQHIIVMTAVMIDKDEVGWSTNGAGLKHSHTHGFGLMDAWRLVNAAKVWKTVPAMATVTIPDISHNIVLDPQMPVTLEYDVAEDFLFRRGLLTLEYVQVTVTIAAVVRGNIIVNVTCPSGTTSALATKRPRDNSEYGFLQWTFSTVRCWGEPAAGLYKLSVENIGEPDKQQKKDVLKTWSLTLHGSAITQLGIRKRMELVQNASSGEFLRDDIAVDCDQPPAQPLSEDYVPEIILKVLSAVGALFLVLAIYELVEVVLLRKYCWEEQPQSKPKDSNSECSQPLLSHDGSASANHLGGGGSDSVSGVYDDSRATYSYELLPNRLPDVTESSFTNGNANRNYQADASRRSDTAVDQAINSDAHEATIVPMPSD